jgi:hypothetical protein
MPFLRSRQVTLPLAWMMSVLSVSAADTAVTQVDWDTRTASCPARVTKSTNVTIRLTNVNDLLIDFGTGDVAQYQLRAKGTPVSVVPPQNLFLGGTQAANTALPQRNDSLSPCDAATLTGDLTAVATMNNALITPQAGGPYISLNETLNAALNAPQVIQVERDMASGNVSCTTFFSNNALHPVVQWIKHVNAQPGSNPSGAPPHSIDFNVNLEPNENYQFTIQESWKGINVKQGTVQWNCGETDVLTLSAGPLVTTLPYRTYNQQLVPNSSGTGSQNVLVVSGTTNVNVLGAALLNYSLPALPHQWPGMGFAISVGPVYALNSAPSVSKLGLFVGGSFHLYRSIFLTPGVHIGQFADYPAGFHSGSPIPSGFGGLTPVTRNTAHFAIGITFKTATFKKSSQSSGGAANTGATQGGNTKPAQSASGSHGAAGAQPNPAPPASPANQQQNPQP